MTSANKKGRLKHNSSDGLSINPSKNKCRIKQNPLRLQGIFIFGCGSRIRTYDLRVMSPTSYLAAPSRVNYKEDVGFEPTHAFTRLTVFKTVPFSRTWVILHKI